jgi:hypothetical protein
MARLAATIPDYASVARASEVLHLAPRSVRDLIYAGRIPSQRIGRLHYLRAADLELERRRRLGLPLPRRTRSQRAGSDRPRRRRSAEPRNHSLDAALRRQRAAERSEQVARWAKRHGIAQPHVPARVLEVSSPFTCESCGRTVRRGRAIEMAPEGGASAQLCTSCGRRALLEWADSRRQEATAARQMAHSLGQPESAPVDPRPAELLQQVLLPTAPVEAAAEPQTEPTNPRAA